MPRLADTVILPSFGTELVTMMTLGPGGWVGHAKPEDAGSERLIKGMMCFQLPGAAIARPAADSPQNAFGNRRLLLSRSNSAQSLT